MSRGMIHDITVLHALEPTVDAEGRADRNESVAHVRGRAASFGGAGVSDVTIADQRGEMVDAVVLVPTGTLVSRADRIIVPDANGYEGTYEVVAIRPTMAHLRLHVRRFNL